MNILTQNNIKTMSSRELASLCNKAHDNVLKTIRSLIKRGVVLNTIPQTYIHEQNGQRYTEFLSNKRDSLVIVARLSPEFTADVVDRWQELEQQVSASSPVTPALPHDYISALEELLITKKGEQLAQEQLAIAAPKAAALDTLSHAKGSLGVRETAKAVGIPEREFVKRCLDKSKPMSSRFLYRDDKGRLNAHAHRIKQGFMTQKIGSYEDKDGYDFTTVQVKFTAAGVAHIAKLMQNKATGQLRVV
jgi:phage regulator Rha-like protein